MSLIKLFRKNESITDIYSLIEKSENGEEHQREDSIDYLKRANSLYQELIKERGIKYCMSRCPDVPRRMNILIDKLIEYHS